MFTFRKNGHFYEKVGKKGEPVCIDDEIPFDVPANWELCRLENLCSLLNPKIGEHGKYPYLNAKFLRNKTDPEIKEKGRFIQINTKVILVDGENSGEVFLTHEDGYMGSTFRLLDINSQIFDKYILKLIELWRNPLKKSKKGAAIPHLNKDIFNNIFVGIPPLNEQKRIVNQINSLMPLIIEYGDYKEKLDKLNSEFPDKLKSSILQEAIQGKLVPQNPNDEPASVLLERIKNEKERLIKEKKIKRNKNESYIFKENNHYYEKIKDNEPICIDNEIPFEIPESWIWCRLGDISFITKLAGFEYTKYISPNITTKGIPLLKAKYIKEDKLLKNFEHYIPKKLSDNLIRSKVNKKCILTPYVGASIGNVVLFEGDYEAHLAPNLAKIVMYGSISENYIVNYIKSPLGYSELTKYMKSTAQPSISMAALRDMLVPLPSLKEQEAIIKKIEEISILKNNIK